MALLFAPVTACARLSATLVCLKSLFQRGSPALGLTPGRGLRSVHQGGDSALCTRVGTPLCAPGCISAVTCASKCLGAVPILKRTENWNQPRCPSAGEWINLDIFMGWNAMQQKRGPTAGVPNSMDAPQKPDEWKKTEVGEFIL